MYKFIQLLAAIIALTVSSTTFGAENDVIVFSGLDETIDWLENEGWWGEEKRGVQLSVPHSLITGIGPNWRSNARSIPVSTKKEVFYRLLLPLIMHANSMVLDRRQRLNGLAEQLAEGVELSSEDQNWVRDLSAILRIGETTDLKTMLERALYKLDIIPAALALGQAAYESGYGTSRFAAQGNALFGQWTFGGKGLKPQQQRSELGDHRIAAFDWPFDSVRGYFINLNSHPAYAEFRKLRADLRKRGQTLDSLILADGLVRYSERGQKYVDTLKGIIRVNKLDIADDAVFRDEPLRFLVVAKDKADKQRLSDEVERMRTTGELDIVMRRMALE